jgi:hypothetical protein
MNETRKHELLTQTLTVRNDLFKSISYLQGTGGFKPHWTIDQRKLAIARTNLETGFLWLIEALNTYQERPTSTKEDTEE